MGKTARPRCFLPPRAFGSASGAAGGGRGSRGSRVTFQHLARSLGVAEEGFARRRQVRDAEAGSRHRAAADPAGRGGGGGGGHLGPAQPARGRKSRTGLGSWTFRPNLGLNCLNLGPGRRLPEHRHSQSPPPGYRLGCQLLEGILRAATPHLSCSNPSACCIRHACTPKNTVFGPKMLQALLCPSARVTPAQLLVV